MKERLKKIFEKHTPHTEMDSDEMMVFMKLLMSKDEAIGTDIYELDKNSEIFKHFKPLLEGFQMQVFLSRLKHMTTLRISLGAFIAIAQHLLSAGSAVMHAYYLHSKLPENTLITLDVVSRQLFPMGFFSEDQLNRIWEEQKTNRDEVGEMKCIGSPDNLLDYAECWDLSEFKNFD
jgi:hypothetical protein